jgi:hypothetical protein
MESTIVNFGNGEFAVEILAITDKGEKLRQTVQVKGGEYGTIPLPRTKTIVSIEADPAKIIPQKGLLATTRFLGRLAGDLLAGQRGICQRRFKDGGSQGPGGTGKRLQILRR